MKSTTSLLLLLMLVLASHTVLAADPNFRLQQNDVVTVNPDTNRATVTRDGVTIPMWDGAHRMRDGSVLIINRGIAVPNKATIETRRLPPPRAEEWEGAQIAGYSPCEKLVRRVCGVKNRCGEAEGCNLARQLLDMEQDERAAGKDRNRMTYTSGQCQNVMMDGEVFPVCAQAGAPTSGQ
jgi:hypothetical protein